MYDKKVPVTFEIVSNKLLFVYSLWLVYLFTTLTEWPVTLRVTPHFYSLK